MPVCHVWDAALLVKRITYPGLLKIICCSRDFTGVRITPCFLALWELRKCIGTGLVVTWHVDDRFTVFPQSVTKASRFGAYHTGPEMVGGQADRLNCWEASACLGLWDGFLCGFIARKLNKRNAVFLYRRKRNMRTLRQMHFRPPTGWQCEYVSPEIVLCITGAAATNSATTNSAAGETAGSPRGRPVPMVAQKMATNWCDIWISASPSFVHSLHGGRCS